MYLSFTDTDGRSACAVVGAYAFDLLYLSGHALIRVYRDPSRIAPETRPIDSWRFDFGSLAGLPNPDPTATPVYYETVAQVRARASALTRLDPALSPGDALTRAILETAARAPGLAGAQLEE